MMERVVLTITLFSVVILAGVRTSASADDWGVEYGADGNELVKGCKTAVQKTDEPSRIFSKQEVYNSGFCEGFVSGIADSVQSDAILAGIPRVQLERVVVKYLEDHPEKLSLSSSFLVREALIKAFPKVPTK